MSNDLSKYVYKIDLKYIIDNCTDKKLWGVKWCIFKYKDMAITMSLLAIDVENARIELRLKCNWLCERYSFNFDEEHYKENVILNGLYSKIYSLIAQYEYYYFINRSEAYELAIDNECNQEHKLKNIANEFLDFNNVSNDAIREAYVEKYFDTNKIYFTNDVRDKMQFYFIADHYVAFSLLVDDKKNYENFIKKIQSIPKDYAKDIEEELLHEGDPQELRYYICSMELELEDDGLLIVFKNEIGEINLFISNTIMERDYPSDDELAFNIIRTVRHYMKHGYIYKDSWCNSFNDIDDKLFLEY